MLTEYYILKIDRETDHSEKLSASESWNITQRTDERCSGQLRDTYYCDAIFKYLIFVKRNILVPLKTSKAICINKLYIFNKRSKSWIDSIALN